MIEYSKDEITPLNNLIGYKMPFYIDLSVKSNIYIQNKSDKDFDKYLVIDHISEIIEHLTLNLLHITPKYQLRLAIIDNSQDINFSKYLKYFNDYNIMKFDKIIRDNKKQSDYLKDLWTLKFERDDLFAIKNVENYYEYNELNGVEPLERRIIIINDFNLLNEQDQKRVMDISSKGCDTGIHFICVGFEKVKSDIYLSQSMNFSEKN